jgi:acetyl esterase
LSPVAAMMGRWIGMIREGQRWRRILLDIFLHAAALGADTLPVLRRQRLACRRIEDLVYARHGGVPQRLDVYQPEGALPTPRPGLIYLHGGAFAIGSKRSHRAVAVAYAAQGFVVFNVDYRLAPRWPYPAAAEDACAAWNWVLDHAREFGVDPGRIVLAGESAGANLALTVLLAACLRRPEPWASALFRRGVRPLAALLYCGFLQVSRPVRYRRAGVPGWAAHIAEDAALSYLGPDVTGDDPQRALADPVCVVEALVGDVSLPPQFLAAGLEDPVTPDSLRLAQALRRLGAPCALHEYAGETHAFHFMIWRRQARRCWQDSFDFLRDTLQATDRADGGGAEPVPGASHPR